MPGRILACIILLFYLFAAPQLYSQVTAPDFTFVLLPDTQNESQFFPQALESQTQWIVDNSKNLNIQGVLGLGDIVNDGSSMVQQSNADAAFRVLDNAGIPYFLAIGNHDYDGGDNSGVIARSVTGFNQWFGPARYVGKSYYKGNFPSGSNENFYGVLTINGKQYLILVLEYIPRTESLNWAAGIVQANLDKEVIVVTHSFLFVDGTTADRCDTQDPPRADNDGEQMWEAFVSKYPNIIMVVSGHLTAALGAHRSDLGVNGNLVNSMFSNYQDLPDGGNGWLRIVTVHPNANTIEVKTYSPFLNSFMTDPDNQFTVNYHNPLFHTGTGKITGRVTSSGCTKIAGATVTAKGVSSTTDATGRFSLSAPPGSYNVSVSAQGWQTGTRTAQVNDNYATDMNFYLVAPSPCPLQGVARSVTICTPASGASLESPVHLVAATGEPVMRMEIWVDGVKFSETPGNVVDTNLPLSIGTHAVAVVADEVDTSYFSSQVSLGVQAPSTCTANPSGPSITVCAPANGSTVTSPVQVNALTTDSNPVNNMEIWVDGAKAFETFANHIQTALTMAPGAHRFVVVAIDSTGFRFTQVNSITVSSTPPPSSTFTVTPGALNFGTVTLNNTSAPQTVTLSNSGSTAVSISGITRSGDFAQASNTCGTTLAAGGTCAVGVTFTPTVAGTRNGSLTITDSAAGSPHTVALSGTGQSPPPPPGSCTANPSGPSITVCAPANGSTVTSPVQVNVLTTDTNPVNDMEIWVDGVKAFEAFANHVQTDLTLAPGAHRFVVVAIDSTGFRFTQVNSITVQ